MNKGDRGSKRKARAHRATREFSSPACLMAELEHGHESPRTADVRIKRIYDRHARDDGLRVLVDRIWPRGIKKADAALDHWAKELAPSTALRTWFAHDARRWPVFRARYRAELEQHAEALRALRDRAGPRRITLLFAARDERINHAAVLQEVIAELR
jgi:uncharacterized protein YeaO (DUF488 family)